MQKRATFQDWQTIRYAEAWEKQQLLFNEMVERKLENRKSSQSEHEFAGYIIFCEHPHVITLGKSGKESNLLYNEKTLSEKGIDFHRIDRGGDITYHGPGQIVGYPILDLEVLGLTVKSYVHIIEQSIIDFLKEFNITAERLEGATGVWLDANTQRARKICAIGIRASRFVTMHGFAFNINTDLSYFRLMNPCGFTDKGVTSLAKELNKEFDIAEIKKQLLSVLSRNLGVYTED